MIASLVAVGFLIYTGFLYIISKGNEDKLDKAQKSLIYTIIGLLIIFLAPLVLGTLINYLTSSQL